MDRYVKKQDEDQPRGAAGWCFLLFVLGIGGFVWLALFLMPYIASY